LFQQNKSKAWKKVVMEIQFTKTLIYNYFEDIYVEHGHVEDVANGNLGGNNGNSVAHLFRDATWLQSSNTFSPEPLPYSGGRAGLRHEYTRMPTYLHLFGLFWTHMVLNCICVETNRYAREDEGGKPKGGGA
jgi:hypothetical protein